MRRPSSSAAWTATARAVPTPASVVRAATGCDESRRREPCALARMSCPMPIAEFFSDPVPRSIARSSAELSARAPWDLSRSRGRSQLGSSLILEDIHCSGKGSEALLDPPLLGATGATPPQSHSCWWRENHENGSNGSNESEAEGKEKRSPFCL